MDGLGLVRLTGGSTEGYHESGMTEGTEGTEGTGSIEGTKVTETNGEYSLWVLPNKTFVRLRYFVPWL
jgi:hypothetical protein